MTLARPVAALARLLLRRGDDAGDRSADSALRPTVAAPAPARDAARADPLPAARRTAQRRGQILYVERGRPRRRRRRPLRPLSEQSDHRARDLGDRRARDLRPHPLPGPGDLLSAAGPVYTGSYGQRQIQAVEVGRRRASHRAPELGGEPAL